MAERCASERCSPIAQGCVSAGSPTATACASRCGALAASSWNKEKAATPGVTPTAGASRAA
eukprot:7751701-Prorocentrum_lima.AAC.1